MNKYTEQAVKGWERTAHRAAVNNSPKAFQMAVQMRNFNTCNLLRVALVAGQLKKYRGY